MFLVACDALVVAWNLVADIVAHMDLGVSWRMRLDLVLRAILTQA